jgi:uncharacterized tellurite resistance protein B-like protein
MLKAVRKFLSDITSPGDEDRDPAADERLAATALLIHMSGIDGEFAPEESEKLRELLKSRFSLDATAAEKLIAEAREADLEAVDLYAFTSVLKDQLDAAGRARIVEMMWEMVFADGQVHEFEDNLVWRVAELLGVSSRERVRLKQKVRHAAGLD